MSKIMLVEDDNNLREIYEARLLAEGYEIVSAKDGEEALAMAVKEKPDLIISDVMMPKISGFDMLDILRSTPETKNTKVIMMTALSQVEDRDRADKLGADRYLVKSQVTLEDVAQVARDVLNGDDGDSNASYTDSVAATAVPEPAPAPVAAPESAPAPVVAPTVAVPEPAPAAVAAPAPEPAPTPAAAPATAPEPAPMVAPTVATPEPTPAPAAAPAGTQTTADEASSVQNQIDSYVAQLPAEPVPAVEPVLEPADPGIKAAQLAEAVNNIMEAAPAATSASPAPTEPASAPAPATSAADAPSQQRKVIVPINDPTQKPDLNELLQKEQEKEAAEAPVVNPPAVAPQTPAAPESDEKIDPHSIAL